MVHRCAEQSQQSPEVIQTELWQNLAESIEEKPEKFQKSDSVEA
ncbi:hypothetical protein [Pseudoalteromonas sp. S16_S37]|nr:hypothetical protein [Pseudoalteromonas sp. S16_S37]